MNRTAALLTSALVVTGAAALAAAPPASASVPACGNSSLSTWATPTQGATGHGSLVLLFRNTSTHTCTVRGYPGLAALNLHGNVIANARRTQHGFAGGSLVGVPTVAIAPGHYASATVEWLNFNPATAGPCPFSHSIAATPANTSATVHVIRSVSVCDLQVHPTVWGKTGNAG